MAERNFSNRPIKKNHSTAMPRYIIGLDCETKKIDINPEKRIYEHQFRCGVTRSCRLRDGIAVNKETLRHIHPEQVWDSIVALTGKNHTTWVVAHNMLFDFVASQICDKLETGDCALDWPRRSRNPKNSKRNDEQKGIFCVMESPPTIICVRIRSTQGRVVFIDTMNYFREPLKSLGDAIGLPKLAMPSEQKSIEEWFIYCERDTEIVLESFLSLIKYVKENDFGMFRYTISGQSMAAFRHKFMKHKIVPHENEWVKSMERRAYFGGRISVFRAGKIDEPCHQLDVNSLYPHVMALESFPSELELSEKNTAYRKFRNDFDPCKSVAEVQVYTEKSIFPIRGEERVAYPTGTFRTVLCGEELALAFDLGCIESVRCWSSYRLKPLFSDFVHYMYNLRLGYKSSANEIYAKITKQLMTSLHGKFGQLSPSWVSCPDQLDYLPWARWSVINAQTREVTKYRSIGWDIQREQMRAEISGTFVAISAFICSAARCRMNRLRSISGQDNTYYQATDSLIVNNLGLEKLKSLNEISDIDLGRLRHELSAEKCEIIAANTYNIGNKRVAGGLPRGSVAVQDGPTTSVNFLVSELLFAHNYNRQIVEVEKSWPAQQVSVSGNVGTDGWVMPLHLTETW